MISARLRDVATPIGARLAGADHSFVGVSTDTRTLARGNLFVALVGERHDGHSHAEAAAAQGAAALLVQRELPLALPQLVVRDAQYALGELARWWRSGLSTRVVAITGSNGKTTVKQLTACVLAEAGVTAATPGNLNNEIGLPLTVLALGREHRFAVLEMGAGKPGDIAYLARIGQPQVALVNNVGPAHLERLGSLDGVAATKGEIYEALGTEGIGVVNADDAYASNFHALLGARRQVEFALERRAQVTARNLQLGDEARFTLVTPAGSAPVCLPLRGQHNVMNALAAAAIGHACGLAAEDIARGLARVTPIPGRMIRHASAEGWVLFDDSYNANPASVRAGMGTLAAGAPEAWVVLGDMRELGPQAAQLHAEVGREARALGITRLYTVGALSEHAASAFGVDAHSFPDRDALAGALLADLRAGVHVLVKGSRGSGMERVVNAVLLAKGLHSETEAHHAA